MADELSAPVQAPEIIARMGAKARAAADVLARADRASKDRALTAAAKALRASALKIFAANRDDLAAAADLAPALRDRLVLDEGRLEAIAAGLEAIADLPDPVGRVLADWSRPNGLQISRIAVPLGVIGLIYESRPNVTADAGGLCLKAGSAVILRGGSEAVHTNRAIHAGLVAGLQEAGLPAAAIQLVPEQDRALVGALLAAHDWLDILVPRGGKSLVARVQAEARVPVFAHLEGICHVYVHAAADPDTAAAVVVNAKMRRPGICGAMETLLIDAKRLDLLPRLAETLAAAGCALRGDDRARAVAAAMDPASELDWRTEYLAPILSVRVVDGLDAAMAHVARYGSGHTDAIITEDQAAAERFLAEVDSAIVMVNASTQFADGGEFGFGAELGIATGRVHARGPVGLEQLTSFNYRVRGTGQVRD